MSDTTSAPGRMRGSAIRANGEEMVPMDDLPGTVSFDRPAMESISIHVVRENNARLAELVRLFNEGVLQVAVHDIVRFAAAQEALDEVEGCRVRFFQPLNEDYLEIFLDTVYDKTVHAFLLLEEVGVRNAKTARAELIATLEKV